MTDSSNIKSIKTQEELLQERMNGKLPVINIAGHPFYVDIRMQALRPHDDFSTQGIPFTIFDNYQVTDEVAVVPYSPNKHEVKDVDIGQLTAIPQDWILVVIPHPMILDPYGFARESGLPIDQFLKLYPIQNNLQAEIIPWEKTNIPKIVEQNNVKLERKRSQHPASGKSDEIKGENQRRKK